MSAFRIIHLSDIHIGDTYMPSKDIAYRIISDIESERISGIQSVVVTGDIFEGKFGETEQIINEAVGFFTTLADELKQSNGVTKNDFLFVPGNHDINRTDEESKQWTKYRAFLERFYDLGGKLPGIYDPDDFSLLKTYDESRMAFVGFNSCGLGKEPIFDPKVLIDVNKIDNTVFEGSKIDKGELISFLKSQADNTKYVDFGEITPKQILNVSRKLRKYDDYNIVAFFHHHFYLFPEVVTKYGDSSLIRNYTNVIQQLQQARVKTVLHGHKHFDLERPLITDSYYENAKNSINVIAGGSVGTGRVTKHTFNIIDFYDKESDVELIQRKFVYNGDQLEPIVIRQIPPLKNNNGLSIKLLETFKFIDPDLFSKYTNAVEKINIADDDYKNLQKWLENVFVGFEEVSKLFETDSMCLFFLLFAMNYRVLKLKQKIGKETINSSYYSILDDLLKQVADVGFDKKQYLKLFDQTSLHKLKEGSDKLLATISDKKTKYYLSFSMIAVFFTDVYLMLRYYAGSFYNTYVKYKVNIKLDETEFHQDVPVHKIMIHSDMDRRSAYIDLKCNSATAHKMAVLFVKEFELIISKFEDYFRAVGLKLYYITPKIEKNNLPNAIDNYNFEAYIPTLIPLLTGDNIYDKKEVFARELIQNSIDAISVRAAKGDDFDKTIYITLGQSQGKKFFRIKDNGTGMDRFKIERYFTSIGRSFYSGDEYRDLDIDYKPISNFGIGFLSVFMVGREIDVKTRYYLDDSEGIRLHIPNYDGCFFIEKDDSVDIGTEITLYIDNKISRDIKDEQIIDYINSIMMDISCDIIIMNESDKSEKKIESHSIRHKLSHEKDEILFIPFLDTGDTEAVNVEMDIKKTDDYISKYPYGLIIDLSDRIDAGAIMNSGIKLNNTSVDSLWRMLWGCELPEKYTQLENDHFIINLPSNYLNIDVSRERIASLTKMCSKNEFKEKVLAEVANQINQFIELSKNIMTNGNAICFNRIIKVMEDICINNKCLSSLKSKFYSMEYRLYIKFNDNKIDIFTKREEDKPEEAYEFNKENICIIIDSFKKNGISYKPKRDDYTYYYTLSSVDYISRRVTSSSSSRNLFVNSKSYEHIKTSLKVNDYDIFMGLLIATLSQLCRDELPWNEYKKFQTRIKDILLEVLWNQKTVYDIEKGKGDYSISFRDLKQLIKKFEKENVPFGLI